MSGAAGSSLDQAADRADLLIEVGRHAEARELLARRLAEEPSDVRAWARMFRCHTAAGEYEEAERALDQASAYDPDYAYAHILRSYFFHGAPNWHKALAAGREAVRCAPDEWSAHVALARSMTHPFDQWPAALEVAFEAVRLAPGEPDAHHAVYFYAELLKRQDLVESSARSALAVDPECTWAHKVLAEARAADPTAKLSEVADSYATALGVLPQDREMHQALRAAVYRMLRGTRWLALLCVAIAGVTGRLFPGGGPADLPVPLGTRLYALAVMGAVWGFGAWRRYRRMRTGVRLSFGEFVRTNFWGKVAVGQAAWCTLCAVVVVAVPWTERLVPQILFWLALVPTLLTIWFERAAMRSSGARAGRS
ncbi:tetratricopeptide repeat protein [Streptomyces sp. NBC_00237]|uniref:tetratricopeptide repeat protein n=1 Tax=Streptomyces sp. NBC_00237 TaxID=2975687 RepID=UPI00225B8696|nr:tetratricopeptide repeat protein [Streptomyces sp. NBC_00237]MCX5201290.1 tetratricopeptide repeat protein [Streptomyces sp. NBC_00237]